MEPICAIKDIYKILYQFEKNFSEVHAITINEAMLLCCLKDNEAKSAGMICDYIGLSNSRVSKVIMPSQVPSAVTVRPSGSAQAMALTKRAVRCS